MHKHHRAQKNTPKSGKPLRYKMTASSDPICMAVIDNVCITMAFATLTERNVSTRCVLDAARFSLNWNIFQLQK